MKSKRKKENTPDRELILSMFHRRCVRCGEPSETIHEIRPRSRGKASMEIANRVILCYTCHDYVHSIGANASEVELLELREKALRRYGDQTVITGSTTQPLT